MEGASGWVPFDPATGDWVRVEDTPAVPPDAPRRGVGPTLWTILLGLDLGLLGLFLVITVLALALPERFAGGALPSQPGSLRTALWAQAAFNLVALGAIPFAWVMGTRVRPWAGAVRYLHLERPLSGLLKGVLWGAATLGALVLLGVAMDALHYRPPNDQADAILKSVTPALAAALALSAGVGEEIFFRGLLQKRLGVWGQALLFGLFHLSYGTPLQVIVPGLLGLLYGFLIQRGAPLWTTIAAHFVFDYVQLSSPFWIQT